MNLDVHSVDARAGAATDELRAAVSGRAPAASEIVRRGRARRSARIAVTVAAMVAVVLGGLAFGMRAVGKAGPRPAETPVVTPSPTSQPSVQGLACQMPGVTCTGPRIRFTGQLRLPVSVVPAGIDTDDLSAGQSNLEMRRADGEAVSGITVFEDAHPVDASRDNVVPSLEGATGEQVARWLSTRSFVQPTHPIRTTVGGLQAWRVVVRMRPGAPQPSFANSYPAALTFQNGDGFSVGGTCFVSERLPAAYYYLVDVPRQAPVVVWVWTWQGDQNDLDAMDAMVTTMRFG